MASVRIKVRITEHERHRRAAGLSATAMGRALGLADHSYISHVERGAVAASPQYRSRAALLLQVGTEVLFDEDGFAR